MESDFKSNKNKKSAGYLNSILADEHLLYMKINDAYYKAKGQQIKLPKDFFEIQSNSIKRIIDSSEKKIHFLGYLAIGSLINYLKTNYNNEIDFSSPVNLISRIKIEHEKLILQLLKCITIIEEELRDNDISNYMKTLKDEHEKMIKILNNYKVISN